jgi:hypothetical protein
VTRRRQAGVALLALAAAGGTAAGLALAFTGGARSQPTRTAYLARVAAVCSRYGPRLDEIPPPADLAIPGEVVGTVARALPLLKAELAAVRPIRAPAALKSRLDRFFALTQQSIDELQRALTAARRSDLGAMGAALLHFADVRDEAKTISRSLGFRC